MLTQKLWKNQIYVKLKANKRYKAEIAKSSNKNAQEKKMKLAKTETSPLGF
jgi:hypothetical protein